MKENYFMGMDGFVWFTGVVEDRNDPSKLGRVKVRCLGLHTESLVDIPTEDLPWAHIMQSTNNPSMQGLGNTPSFLVEGTWVVGFFLDAVEKQQPLIMGTLPGIPQAVADKTKGFNDPNGTYPSEKITHSDHAIQESDVNRLARNDTDKSHAVVSAKNTGRTTGVALANSSSSNDSDEDFFNNLAGGGGTTWDEPSSAYAASYPKNHVMETESGHIKEYDDTSGAERIHEYHTKGTFYEIDKDGNKVTRVVGDNYEVIAGSDYVNVKGSANLTVSETLSIKAKNIQMEAETINEVYGTHTETSGTITESYTTLNTNISGTTGIKYGGDATHHYVSAFKEKIDGDTFVDKAGGKVDHVHPVSPARTSGEDEVSGL